MSKISRLENPGCQTRRLFGLMGVGPFSIGCQHGVAERVPMRGVV